MAIIYKSTNADAPVMTGADNTSIVRVLRACLVDGYGDKPGAGWVMPFVNADGTKAAFKNAGTGFYLRIDDSAGYYFKCASFESMSDIDTGINAIASEYSDRGRESLNNNAIPWVVAANDKFVFLVIYTGYSSYPNELTGIQVTSLFFGDFTPNRNGDGFCCVSSDGSSSSNTVWGSLSNNIYIARNYAGVVGGIAARLLIPFAYGLGYSQEVYSNNVNLLVSKVMVIEGGNIIRGFLDECLAPLQKIPFYNGETVSIGEKSYEAITWAYNSSYIYQLLFEVTG